MIYSDDQFYSLGKKMKFLEMWYQSTEFAVFINPNAKSVEKMLKKKKNGKNISISRWILLSISRWILFLEGKVNGHAKLWQETLSLFKCTFNISAEILLLRINWTDEFQSI